MSIMLTAAALAIATLMVALSATGQDRTERTSSIADKAKAEIIRDAHRAEIARLGHQDRARS